MACMRLSRARFGLSKGYRILHRSAASLSAVCAAPERQFITGRARSFSSGARASDSAVKTQSGAMDNNFVFDGSPESAAMAKQLLEEAKHDGEEGIDVRREVHTVYSGRDRWRDINKPKAVNRKSQFAMTEPAMMAHQKVAEPLSLDEAGWTPQTKRTALIGLKCGMLPEWDPWGRRMALTVIKLERCQVVQVKRAEEHAQGKNMLQIGGGFLKAKRANKPHLGQFEKRGLEPNYRLAEFEVSEDGLLPEGTELTARHFVPGQRVDVVGWSKGKGFAGVMKRWNFAGQPASHGNSKAHRKPGSIGNSTTPGKVWKGKKMAGRLGNERTTTQGLRVYKVDEWRDLIYVQGAIPGPAGSFVFVRDSNKRKPTEALPLPTPTFGGMPGTEGYESEMTALQERREVLDAMDGFSPMAARAMRDRGMLPDGAPVDPPAFELIAPYDSVDPLTKEIL